MKIFAPNYYKKFSCIADKCKHSCCIGWEIDIDDDTLKQYNSIETEFGKKIKENIDIIDGCACFKLTENERCPFLNQDNLCEIILNVGENSLCQICSDHPRFKNFFGDKIEVGLGLTCEEAARIIVYESETFEIIEIDETDENPTIYEDEIEFFGLRNEIFHIINNEKNFQSIVNELLNKFSIEFPKKSVYEWVDIYTQLEILDDDWMTLLSKLKSSEITQITLSNSLNNELKNLLIYFIYRHLSESIYDGKFNGRLLFAILSCHMISTLTITNHKIEDIARMYSSEIEYSNENLSSLIDLLQIENLEE